MSVRAVPERLLLDNSGEVIETFVETPAEPRGLALVAHPHPLFGGTADNKVVTTLARSLRECGCATLRPNFRGVGASSGVHDRGEAETTDLACVLDYARARFGELPLYLAGFSFGAYVVARLADRLAQAGQPARRLILVGMAAGAVEQDRHYNPPQVPPDSLIIHGAQDSTVPLAQLLAWAATQEEVVLQVIPAADHFFHRKLHLVRRLVSEALRP